MSDSNGNSTIANSHRTDERHSRLIDRRDYLRYTGALAGASAVAGYGSRTATADIGGGDGDSVEPTNLRVEYTREPNNVLPTLEGSDDTETPRFSWEVAGPRGVGQSAYRVLVAESLETLESETGDVWDSGVVESSRSTNAQFDGTPLEPGVANDRIYARIGWTRGIRMPDSA